MKLKFSVAILVALVVLSTVAFAVPPRKPAITVSVTAQQSFATLDIVPAAPGGSGNPNQWFYEATVGTGSISETFPVQICVTSVPGNDKDGNVLSGYPMDLHFGPTGVGGNLPGVSLPYIPQFNADGCTVANIVVDTTADPLASGEYSKLVEVVEDSAANGAQVSISGKGIHIHFTVNPANPINCFISDSDFNYLLDCAGNQVTSGYAGTFTIVTNNKKTTEVATNPGQFYYNFLWTNTTGVDKTVSLQMLRNNVIPQGMQAIHAMIFPSTPVLNASNFDAVNSGIPSGHNDVLESVVVPAGYTLWVDYHLQWAGLGFAYPAGIGTSCGTANQALAVTGTLLDVSGATPTTIGSCGAGASGWKK